MSEASWSRKRSELVEEAKRAGRGSEASWSRKRRSVGFEVFDGLTPRPDNFTHSFLSFHSSFAFLLFCFFAASLRRI